MTRRQTKTVPVDTLLTDWRSEWARLAEAHSRSAVFLDPYGTDAFRHASSSRLTSEATVEDGRLAALSILAESRVSVGGVPLRALSSINADKFGRYEFFADPEAPAALDELWASLLRPSRCAAVLLHLVPTASPTITAAREAAHRHGWRIHTSPQFSTPRRPLPPRPEDWGSGLKSKFRSNLRNRERRIAKLGDVRFEMISDTDGLAASLPDFYALESAGWKWEDQSSIAQKPAIKSFYERLAMASGDSIRLAMLYLDDRPIAAQLLRVLGEWIYVLKIGHHPEFRKYSPGQLIMRRTIERAVADGCRHLDFLGEEETWKSDWNPEADENVSLALFAPTARGRYAYWMSYGIRERVKKVPGARKLVAAVRQRGRRR